jgi:hypothetical protein
MTAAAAVPAVTVTSTAKTAVAVQRWRAVLPGVQLIGWRSLRGAIALLAAIALL